MSIYISGIEMPKEHPLYITLRPDGSVHVWDSYNGNSYGTQAIPVPPHGDLIERNHIGLTDFEIVMCDENFKEGMKMLLEKVETAPTIIPTDPAKEGKE